MTLSRLIFPLAMTCLLAACGQRGPLFLPEDSAAPVASQQNPDAQAEDAEDDGDADQKDDDQVHGGGFENPLDDES